MNNRRFLLGTKKLNGAGKTHYQFLRPVFWWLFCPLCFTFFSALAVLTQRDLLPISPGQEGLEVVNHSVVRPVVFDRHGQRLNVTYQNHWNLHDQRRLDEIPEFLVTAFVLAEDKRFYQHNGPDWLARLNAAWQNLAALKVVRGASTITEQVVRMLHPRPRTIWSRWLEGWEASMLEQQYSKADILEFYLNQVPYGARRRGVSQAAHYYFGRDLETLSKKEMLTLAVLVRSPSGLSPRNTGPDQRNKRLEKSLAVLTRRLVLSELLSPERAENLLSQYLVPADTEEPLNTSHFLRYVGQQWGISDYSQRTGHYQQTSDIQPARDFQSDISQPAIHSSLDLELQQKVQNIMDTRLSRLQDRNVGNGAVLVADHQSGEILSWVVGHAGEDNKAFNQINAVVVPRQPGSALKPFVYVLALQQGWNAATMIDDRPLQSQVGSGMHQYHNYSRSHYGLISLREALGNSLNIPAIKAIEMVGAANFLSFLRDLGIDSLNGHPNVYGDGIALGNGEVTLFELVQAYTTLARMGHYTPLTVFQGEGSIDGGASGNPSNRTDNHVVPEPVASLMADILSDPSAREKEFGWHSILNLPYQTAVKTGTSSDYRDAWAVGFNDRYTVGVWMGNMDYQPMLEVTGSTGPAVVLRSVFHELNKNRRVNPLPLSDELLQVRICRDTGLPVSFDRVASKSLGAHCELKDEWFTQTQLSSLEKAAESSGPLRIRKPSDGLHLAMDPRIPDEAEYFEFELSFVDGVERVDWYLNDQLVVSTTQSNMLWQVNRGEYKTYAVVWQDGNPEPVRTEPVNYIVH